MSLDHYQKRIIAFKNYLLGKEYYRALKAFSLAQKWHTGIRKDGITPEIVHPLCVAQYVQTTESGLLFPEDTIIAAILHDLREDYSVTDAEIRNQFGDRVADALERLRKVGVDSPKKNNEIYFYEMSLCPIASVVKGGDRIHNQPTMIGVFTYEKQVAQITETRQFVLPMIKGARENFPEQFNVYQNIKLVLHSQVELIEALHKELLERTVSK